MNVRYRVTLSEEERTALEEMLGKGRSQVQEVKRAQILLTADQGASEDAIAKAVRTSPATIYRTKRCFVEQGLVAALHEAHRPGCRRKLSDKEEALLAATACSTPPAGRARWTLDLLADKMVYLTAHDSPSRATSGRRLPENDLRPWQHKMWCVLKFDRVLLMAASRNQNVLSTSHINARLTFPLDTPALDLLSMRSTP
jgi:transposase